MAWTRNPDRPRTRETVVPRSVFPAPPSIYPICVSGKHMLSPRTMPQFLRYAPTMIHLECACGCSIDDWRQEITNTKNEMFVRLSSWHLEWWEREMRLPPRPNDELRARQDRVIARMRAWQLPTTSNIVNLSRAYQYGDVWPVMAYEQHFITYWFLDSPLNRTDLEAELDRITPARLGINFLILYVVWGDYEQAGVTWCQVEDAGWTWAQMDDATQDLLPPLTTIVCSVTAVWGEYELEGVQWCQPQTDGWTWADMERAYVSLLPPLGTVPCPP